jgi:hypothetical protein
VVCITVDLVPWNPKNDMGVRTEAVLKCLIRVVFDARSV